MTAYLGTDVGGTFTDLVYYTDDGECLCLKVPSTPNRPGASVLDGIDELKPGDGRGWPPLVHTHSSTIATNALIERKGAKIGLIVSDGFRDLFELQRLAVPHPMRFDSRRPRPLVPRALVCEAKGRIAADGSEIVPLDEEEVLRAASSLAAKGVEIVVVAFLHSYKNPAHERQARALLARSLPGTAVELSSEVWPQAREYERAVLAAINASVRPLVEAYIDRLAKGIARRGIAEPARIARSNGGAELSSTLRARPVAALLSGPAAGVAGAAAAAEDAGWEGADLLTLDIGGTSADIGVVRGGRPVLSSEEHVAEFPVLLPTIAVSSIGAGGGSILWLDPTGSLKVGPKSVGADPGPASYGSGSRVPALTDAFLLSGLLAPGQRLGGRLPLKLEPALEALATLAGALKASVEDIADGAIRVAVAMMAAEASGVLARRGVDMPRFRMVAFGGAGPLLAALLAEEIQIGTLLIPPFPGALSALGAARADLEGDLVAPVYRRLGELDTGALKAFCAALEAEALAWLQEQKKALSVSEVRIEFAADMRYESQGYDVGVSLAPVLASGGGIAALRAAFHAAHRTLFGHANEEAEIWLKELRAHVVGLLPKPRLKPMVGPEAGAEESLRAVRLFGREFSANVYERTALTVGRAFEGPAIVDQMDTTSFIPEGWKASVVPSGALVLERR